MKKIKNGYTMTPNDIEVLLHVNMTPEPHPRSNAPSVKGAFEMFVKNGIFEQVDDEYALSDKGRAFLNILCKTSFLGLGEMERMTNNLSIATKALKEIENWPFDVKGYDTAKEAAGGMNNRASEALNNFS